MAKQYSHEDLTDHEIADRAVDILLAEMADEINALFVANVELPESTIERFRLAYKHAQQKAIDDLCEEKAENDRNSYEETGVA